MKITHGESISPKCPSDISKNLEVNRNFSFISFHARFRLRRHSNQKHPNLPIRWVDMETGQSSIDTLKPSTTTNRQSGKVIYRETARKSTSKGARLKVAMFRSHPKSSSQRNRQQSQSDSDATIVDKTPFVIGEPYSLVSSDSESEVNVESNVPTRLCCHLCTFKTSERADFAEHLEKSHVELNDSVIVEVLPRGDDSGEVFALRRCGFCTFETYVEEEFEDHVRTHTMELPFRCESCSYASFNRQKVEDHVLDCHPGSEVGVRRLKEPYTMTTGFSGHYWSVNLDAFVELEDVMKISDEAFESVLGTYGVSYDGPDRCVD